MNLYLLFAIALGAIAPQAPAPRPFAAVVAKSGVRAERQVVRAATVSLRRAHAPRASFASSPASASADAPLTGAGTPRAPSA